jgi:hypothetical protein
MTIFIRKQIAKASEGGEHSHISADQFEKIGL